MAGVTFNANFNRFVEWAKGGDVKDKSIANASVQLGKLEVLTKSGDGVGLIAKLFKRTVGHARDNDATRTLFRDAVTNMFGGESKIPASVKKAMIMSDYNKGRPLTARRILAVKVAIDAYNAKATEAAKPSAANGLMPLFPSKGPKGTGTGADIIANGLKMNAGVKLTSAQAGLNIMKGATQKKTAAAAETNPLKKIDTKTAKAMVAASAQTLGVSLSSEKTAAAANLLSKYGKGMLPKNARVLSNFIVNLAATRTNGLDEAAEEKIKNIAGDIKKWREFTFGESKLVSLGKKVAQRSTDYINENIGKKNMFSQEHTDVFQQLYGDADRGEWKINGTSYKLGTNPNVIGDKFLSVIKGENARKVVSMLLQQGGLGDIESLISKSPALIGDAQSAHLKSENLYNLKGADMFVHRDSGRDGGIMITRDVLSHYELEVSPDGKTATVTLTADKNLTVNGSVYNEFRIGTASISQRTTIDLTKPMPVVTKVEFSQTFSPDKVVLTPNARPAPEGMADM